MPRATKVERERRIEELVELLVAGVPRRGILAWAAQQAAQSGGQRWDVSERQIDAYLAAARERLRATATPDRGYALGRSLSRLQLLFSKALAAGNLAVALQAERTLAQLLGLNAPTEIGLSGGIDVTTAREDLARRFAELLDSGRFDEDSSDAT